MFARNFIKYVNISFFRKYLFYNRTGNVTENKASGGVTIMVNKYMYIPHNEVRLNTTLQVVATRASIPKTITICSIYLPSSLHWETRHLEEPPAVFGQ